MEIRWYGHSCFKVKGKETSVIFDPYTPGSTGYEMPAVSADIVTISYDDPAHNYGTCVDGKRKILNGPGEYEIGDAIIIGVSTKRGGNDDKRNTIYCVELDDFNICHLGDLGRDLTETQLDEIGQVNVLMLPIGGSLGVKGAVALVNRLQPQYVLPMHYGSEKNGYQYTPVKDFLKEFGAENSEPVAKLNINKNSAPLSMQIVIFDA